MSSFLPGPQTAGEFSMTVRSPNLREVRSVVRPSRPGDGQPCGQALQVPEECPGVLGGGEFPAAPLISIHHGVATSASTRPLSPRRAQWASILQGSRSVLLASPTDLEADSSSTSCTSSCSLTSASGLGVATPRGWEPFTPVHPALIGPCRSLGHVP